MTIVIQNVETRDFLSDWGGWVREPREALTFSDTRHALAYCHRHHLQNVRLVVFFADRKLSLLLYVPGSKAPTPTGSTHALA